MIYETRKAAIDNGGKFYFGKPCFIHGKSKRSLTDCKCMKCKLSFALSTRDPEAHKVQALISYHNTKEKNKLKKAIRARTNYAKNTEAIKKTVAEWRVNNPLRARAIGAKRRANLLMATPPWAKTGDVWGLLIDVYKRCPPGMEVDHIVPLQGKNVCGLHVPWNLQYLTKSQNASKGNRLIEDSL